jgi:Ser/Thr protein kinase RdoA (MazF antagonist)
LSNADRFPYVEAVERHYGAAGDRLVSVEPMGGAGINSSNFKAVFRGRPRDPIHVKVLRRPDGFLADRLRAFDRCRQAGAKTAEVIRTRAGELSVQGGDDLLIGFRYYDGQAYGGTRAQRRAAARELARLNAALAALEGPLPRSPRYDPLSPPEVQAITRQCTGDTEFHRQVREAIDGLWDLSAGIEPHLGPARSREYADFHPGNVIFQGDEVLAIVDFQSLCEVARGQSVAFACSRFGRSAAEMAEFVQAYEQEAGPSAAGELERIPWLVQWEALARINYIFRSAFFHGDAAWSPDLAKHLGTIRRMRNIGGAFVEQFARTAREDGSREPRP